MAETGDFEWDRALMEAHAVRNLSVAALNLCAGIVCGWVAGKYVSTDLLIAVLKDLWVVQAVLAAAVVSLIYRLQSDAAIVGHLSALQRSRLDRIVRVKAGRLWVLFLLIAVSAALARIADVVPSVYHQRVVAGAAVTFMISTALFCLYLPSMWNELRSFVTQLSAEKEAASRREAHLKRVGDGMGAACR